MTDTELPIAPFGPWNAFKVFLEEDLKGKAIPSRLDTSMFRTKSGTATRGLKIAFRFFSLTQGEKYETTDSLRALVEAYGSPDWIPALRRLLEDGYGHILEGVSLTSATRGELEEAFRLRGRVNGNTMKKAVRFYLSAATEAGVKLSPHFPQVRVGGVEEDDGEGEETETGAAPAPARSTAVKRGAPRQNRKRNGGKMENSVATPPSGTEAITFPIPGRDVRLWIPKDITTAELDYVLKSLKDYLKLRAVPPTKGSGS